MAGTRAALILSTEVIILLIIGSFVYTYLYPWLYNKVNHITKRGEDLDDEIDIVNTMIMFLSLYLFMGFIVLVIGASWKARKRK